MMPGVVAGFPKTAGGKTRVTLEVSNPEYPGEWVYVSAEYGGVDYTKGGINPPYGTLIPGVVGEPYGNGTIMMVDWSLFGELTVIVGGAGWPNRADFPWQTLHFGDRTFQLSDATFYQSVLGGGSAYIRFHLPLSLPPPAGPMEVWGE